MPEKRRKTTGTGGSITDPPVVAIFNSSPDIVDLLRHALERAGMVVVSVLTHEVREGKVDFEGFLRQHDPGVILYDIAPPYEANWRLFLHTSRMEAMKNRAVVISSVSPRHVEQLAALNRRVYEVVGKEEDLDQIVRAVKEASRARPTR